VYEVQDLEIGQPDLPAPLEVGAIYRLRLTRELDAEIEDRLVPLRQLGGRAVPIDSLDHLRTLGELVEPVGMDRSAIDAVVDDRGGQRAEFASRPART
jgi:hypothetical protein